MKDTILVIDTSDNKKVCVQIKIGEQVFLREAETVVRKNQMILSLIDAVLREHDRAVSDLKEITVTTRGGSFTGLRVGISIANALAFGLKIPVNGKEVGQFVDAEYA